MKRRLLLLACALAALLAAVPVAARETSAEPSRPLIAMTPSHLLGIKQVLTVLAVGLSGLGVAGLILLTAALAPERVARAEQALRSGRWRVLVVGLLATALLLLAATLVGKAAAGSPVLGVAAVLLLGALAWLALYGLTATAGIVGERLLGGAGGEAVPWRRVGMGGLTVGACLLVPVFGWVVFLYLALRGVGAATLTLL